MLRKTDELHKEPQPKIMVLMTVIHIFLMGFYILKPFYIKIIEDHEFEYFVIFKYDFTV